MSDDQKPSGDTTHVPKKDQPKASEPGEHVNPAPEDANTTPGSTGEK